MNAAAGHGFDRHSKTVNGGGRRFHGVPRQYGGLNLIDLGVNLRIRRGLSAESHLPDRFFCLCKQ